MLKRFFLSRKTVISLIFLMLGAILLGYTFPQRFLISPVELDKWQMANPFLAKLSRWFALDHLYTSPWFTVLLAFFLVSLCFSTWEQFRIALRKTREGGAGGESFETSAGTAELAAGLRSLGYLKVGGRDGAIRYVRHPWGYWGNFLLHLGIVVTIASSLVILLCEKRAVVELNEGEVHRPGAAWAKEERGLLAGRLVLPEAVRLDMVLPEFYDNDNLRQLNTRFSFMDGAGKSTSMSMHINKSAWYRGVRIFQGKSHGKAFFVMFRRGNEEHGEIFHLDQPPNRRTPSYKNFVLPWLPGEFKTKFYGDAAQRSPDGNDPLFAMRLTDGGKVTAELSMKVGETGRFGDYTAQLVKVERWGGLIFIDTTGMGGIFFGFFILCLGGALSYLCPPRECSLTPSANGVRVSWRATRFERLYGDEFEELRRRAGVACSDA
ncbi:cytochrome c biogenesis protein ResB [Geobacter hydrogenophilus]|uniref:ResB-like family cytochrome C biogenesis protein n=1 Tax=Geobacter hydrogenophilus TaxID=40983 RepID=A0A9W6G0L4_9BACT|nr:cytochrome c biogenesis protein ResB [Geobacter hydrogenophilus]MBT0894103.1 cytochrome c biogenesis protein ResB [Geobacter hydrogenophilus]GLI38614.1 ResB-like family cytochrome C biogenesis protein [Geobacter hydrogenophilus]